MMSMKLSNLAQFLATWVLNRLKHFIMNLAHNEAGCSTVEVTSPFSLVVVIFSVSNRRSFSWNLRRVIMNLSNPPTYMRAVASVQSSRISNR